jgi:hypothetical protein
MVDNQTSAQLTDVIRLKVRANPKQVGSKAYQRFALYRDGMTVGQYIYVIRNRFGDNEAIKCLLDLQWDSDPKRAFIRLERDGRPVSIRRSASMSHGRTPTAPSPVPGLGKWRAQTTAPRQASATSDSLDQDNFASRLDNALLTSFCEHFFGYGNFTSRFWFVAEQEGGGKDLAEAMRRFNAWDALDRPTLADCLRFHQLIGDCRWHATGAQVQPTWEPFIRIVLALINNNFVRVADDGEILKFQREDLGRLQGDNCVIDLLPLATPGLEAKHWDWSKWCNLSSLADPKSFYQWISPSRMERIRNELRRVDTVTVVFFGTDQRFLKCWSQICETEFQEIGEVTYRYKNSKKDWGVLFSQRGNKKFLVLPHPNARILGNRIEFWLKAAQLLRDNHPADYTHSK